MYLSHKSNIASSFDPIKILMRAQERANFALHAFKASQLSTPANLQEEQRTFAKQRHTSEHLSKMKGSSEPISLLHSSRSSKIRCLKGGKQGTKERDQLQEDPGKEEDRFMCIICWSLEHGQEVLNSPIFSLDEN
jgi:hypothetical protein